VDVEETFILITMLNLYVKDVGEKIIYLDGNLIVGIEIMELIEAALNMDAFKVF
jgi:hypothetical protein